MNRGRRHTAAYGAYVGASDGSPASAGQVEAKTITPVSATDVTPVVGQAVTAAGTQARNAVAWNRSEGLCMETTMVGPTPAAVTVREVP